MAVAKITTMPIISAFCESVRLNRGDLRLLARFLGFRVVVLRLEVLGLVFLRVIAQMFLWGHYSMNEDERQAAFNVIRSWVVIKHSDNNQELA